MISAKKYIWLEGTNNASKVHLSLHGQELMGEQSHKQFDYQGSSLVIRILKYRY